MKSYPSIPSSVPSTGDQKLYVFDKLDGSNIRVEWTRKKGFVKYGTRTRLLDKTDLQFGEVPTLFEDNYAEIYQPLLHAQKTWQKAILFFEYHGEHSFAGNHHEADEKRLTLLDCAPYKKGILPPKEFLKIFEGVDHATLLLHGKVDSEFVCSVRDSTLEGMTFEGVIVKGLRCKTGPGMFKIKSQRWYDKLKGVCQDDLDLYNKLK